MRLSVVNISSDDDNYYNVIFFALNEWLYKIVAFNCFIVF